MCRLYPVDLVGWVADHWSMFVCWVVSYSMCRLFPVDLVGWTDDYWSILVCWRCILFYVSSFSSDRPDMTFAVDWALNNNYRSFSSDLVRCVADHWSMFVCWRDVPLFVVSFSSYLVWWVADYWSMLVCWRGVPSYVLYLTTLWWDGQLPVGQYLSVDVVSHWVCVVFLQWIWWDVYLTIGQCLRVDVVSHRMCCIWPLCGEMDSCLLVNTWVLTWYPIGYVLSFSSGFGGMYIWPLVNV